MSQSTKPETTADNSSTIYVSQIKNRFLRRGAILVIYPIITCVLFLAVPLAAVRKFGFMWMTFTQSAVKMWKLP